MFAEFCDELSINMNDEIFMQEALLEAKKAAEKYEVPIGAVAVLNGSIIGRAHNIREADNNPLGHAELLLLEKVVKSAILPSWRFEEVTIYVTCEPCIMCIGAMLQARVKRIVFGCLDEKAGACGSLYELHNDARLNHRIDVTYGILAKDCANELSAFFKKIRKI